MGDLGKLKLTLEVDGQGNVTGAIGDVERSAGRMASSTSSAGGRMAQDTAAASGQMVGSFNNITSAIQTAVAAMAAWKLTAVIKDTVMFAANLEMANRILAVVGNNTGSTAAEMYKYRDSLKAINITSMAATSTIALFARSGLELDKAIPLARLAQGAARMASLSGETVSSSEALTRITHGIISMQPEVLKLFGITTTLEGVMRKYKQTTGESAETLSEQQRQQLFLNGVLENGTALMSIYVNTLDLAAAKIASSQRPIEELKGALGDLFLPQLSAAAAAFYTVVSDGMKWVRQHTDDLTALKLVLKDAAAGLLFAAGATTAYTVAVGLASVATGGLAAGAGVFTGVWTALTSAVSLSGAAMTTTAIQTGMMGESIAVASTTASIGLLSVKAAFSVLTAAFIGWELGQLLNRFEIVRKAGVVMVYGIMGAWHELETAWDRFKVSWNPFGDEDEQQAKLKKIDADYAEWTASFKKNFAEQMKDVSKDAPLPGAKLYVDDKTAIAKALKDKADAAAAAKKAAADKAIADAAELAEKQAAYNKQVGDAKAAVLKTQADEAKKLLDAQTKDKLAALESEKELGLRSTQSFLDEKYRIETEAYAKLQKDADAQVVARQAVLDTVNKSNATDRIQQAQEEQKVAAAKGEAALAAYKLQQLPAEKARDQAKLDLETVQRNSDLIVATTNNQLAELTAAEKNYQISVEDAATRRIGLLMQQRDAQQAIYDSIKGTEDVAKLARQKAQDQIVAINGKLLDQQLILRDHSAWDAARVALEEYARAAMDLGAQTKGFVTDMLKGMEDALVQFVRHGKISFTSLTNSILDDFARIAVKQTVMGPLAGMLGSMMAGTTSAFAAAAPASGFDAAGSAMASFAPGTLGAMLSGSAAPVTTAVSTGASSGIATGIVAAAPYLAAAAGAYMAVNFAKDYLARVACGESIPVRRKLQ